MVRQYRLNISENELKVAVALNKPIENIGLSKSTYNSLKRWSICNVGDLCDAYIKGDLAKIRGIGLKSFIEIENLLNKYIDDIKRV